jgi:hypothetical protein
MSVLVGVLIAGVVAPGAAAVQYTSDINGVRTIIDKITGMNTTAGALTATVWLLPTGVGAVADAYKIATVAIAPGATYTFPEVAGHVLNPGGAIWTMGSGAGIQIRSSGRMVTQ